MNPKAPIFVAISVFFKTKRVHMLRRSKIAGKFEKQDRIQLHLAGRTLFTNIYLECTCPDFHSGGEKKNKLRYLANIESKQVPSSCWATQSNFPKPKNKACEFVVMEKELQLLKAASSMPPVA